MIDWSKLKAYQNDKRKSFEELCFQLAKRLYGHLGEFTSIDDTGGGDGVEFFLTLRDGTEWGWQAKFYYPQPRLDDSRKRAITTSLTTSLTKHRKLKKWFLCTPTNFTVKGKNNELSWFNSKLKTLKPSLEIEHWGDSELSDLLSEPRMVGKKLYFFGELELGSEWFRQQVEKQIANVSDKFFPKLHTETEVDQRIHSLLGDSSFVTDLSKHSEAMKRQRSFTVEWLDRIDRHASEPEWREDLQAFKTLGVETTRLLSSAAEAIELSLEHLAAGRINESRQVNLTEPLERLRELTDRYDQQYYAIESKRIVRRSLLTQEERDSNNQAQFVLAEIWKPIGFTYAAVDHLSWASAGLSDFKHADFHIFGNAGTGKTHVTSHLTQTRVDLDLPAILLLGGVFDSTSTIEKKVLEVLDIPTSYSWSDFIQALEAYAEASRSRVLIALDALNEAGSIDLWRNELRGFILTLAASPWLALVTTCRESYRRAIWDENFPVNRLTAAGFDKEGLETAICRYFEHFKIKADLTLAPLEHFKHPLYLRIFCEAQNRDRAQEKEVYIGQQTLFEVFDEFLNISNRTVCRRLSKPSSAGLVQSILLKYAQLLWQQNVRHISLQQAINHFDEKSVSDVNWEESFTKALLDEGLLVARDWLGNEDVISFTYDLLGGYLVSQSILNDLDSGSVAQFVESDTFKTRFSDDDYRKRHPLHEDILRALCSLSPSRIGVHLYALTEDETVFAYAIHALFEMNPQFVGQAEVREIEDLFSVESNRPALLRQLSGSATNVGHPLNAGFTNRILTALTMPKRDVSWSEYARGNFYELRQNLERFENACRDGSEMTVLAEARLDLAACYFEWLLTTTHRYLRDLTTRALYWYGRRFPQKLFNQTLQSLEINDPYVSERMLAAAYGVAMALHSDPGQKAFREDLLPAYARKLFEEIFATGARHASTHALVRDYARHTIELSVLHAPKLFKSRERERFTPPFRSGGIRKWGTSDDLDRGRYSGGNAPIHMDFEKYTLGRLSPYRSRRDRRKQYRQHRPLANIFWRIYELGYSLSTFGEIDKDIARLGWTRTEIENGKVDRYGKKYSWIAYFELYGFLEDKGVFDNSHGNPRLARVDIDPSFPEEPKSLLLVEDDFLDDRSMPLRKWITSGQQPNLFPHLIRKEIDGQLGPWVMLSGDVLQEDEKTRRRIDLFTSGLMIQARRREEFANSFLSNHPLPFGWFDLPELFYTFAGETAWADSFPPYSRWDVHFEAGKEKKKVEGKEFHIYRDGQKLNEDQTHQIFDQIYEIKGKGARRRQTELISNLVEKHKLTIKLETTYHELEEPVTKKFRVLIPICESLWESYHSLVNPGQAAVVPSRELVDACGLWIHLPSWDMYDANGIRATITCQWKPSWGNRQSFMYIRQDLLDTFIKSKRLSFFWIVRGERQRRYSEEEMVLARKEDFTPYKYYRQIYFYDGGQVQPAKSIELSEESAA